MWGAIVIPKKQEGGNIKTEVEKHNYEKLLASVRHLKV